MSYVSPLSDHKQARLRIVYVVRPDNDAKFITSFKYRRVISRDDLHNAIIHL